MGSVVGRNLVPRVAARHLEGFAARAQFVVQFAQLRLQREQLLLL
jgi:hypothetical protein